MSDPLTQRLNQILPRITSPSFLSSEGIGNEIACYVFDYPASEELRVRSHIALMMERFASHHRELRVLHLDIFDVVLDYLEKRGLFQKAVEMEAKKDAAAVLRALKGPLAADKICDFIATEHKPKDFNLVLMSGVGRVWPMMRAHNLLSCLHTVMEQVPLVMFYPGSFDGTTLRLFGQIATDTSKSGTKPYYRAFILVPRETQP
jgi:hypothetical protein